MDCFAPRATKTTVPITPLTADDYKSWLSKQTKRTKTWLKKTGFEPKPGAVAQIPASDGAVARVVLGLGDAGDLWAFSAAAETLPEGRYLIDGANDLADAAALGWALACYRFDRYLSNDRREVPVLVWPDACDRHGVESAARAIYLGRDLINTPAGDLGPAELAAAVKEVGGEHGARVTITSGDALLRKNFPAIHAVGRAAAPGREPRLADLRWGDPKAPKLTLVGKGVVFDSGGLDIKPASNMRLMKKDMGGAAAVLALARMVMDAELPVRLRLLIPTVENAVSGDAYRPGDVVPTRKGLTVEIGNTDAEGRMILCDALAEAAKEKPDLLIDMATLTGAARVALGTEVPVLFCNDDEVAEAALEAGELESEPDPLWRLPLYAPYRRFLESKIADICNIASTRFGGAIHAALFLKEFAGDGPWIHIDTMGFNDNPQPGRPPGGEILGIRALFRMLCERYEEA